MTGLDSCGERVRCLLKRLSPSTGTEREPAFLMLWCTPDRSLPNLPFPGAFQGRSNYELPLIFTARPGSHASDPLGGRYANRGNVRAAC